MRIPLTLLVVFAFASSNFAASVPAKGRMLEDINVIPKRVLQRSISPWFYKSLLVSPVEGWVVVRAQLSGTKVFGERMVRSDLGGAYDARALRLTRGLQIAGDFKLDSQMRVSNVLLHLLIYKVADGTMALSFVTLEGAGGDQMDYFGCAQIAVQKNDGSWVEIKGPESLHGKGMEVRATGLRNDFAAQVQMDRFPGIAR